MVEVLILKKRKDFVRVASQGIKAVSSGLILQAAQNLSKEKTSRIGYTATKKIGKAHLRNRSKRRLRAAAREIFPIHALPGIDYVLISRFNTASCNFAELKQNMFLSLTKINKQLSSSGHQTDE